MRFTRFWLKVVLAAGLALGLSACPGMAPFPGVLGIYIHPVGSERCDDGVKVVVEGIEESWDLIGPYLGGGVRDQGDYWIWVEPDVESQMSWDVPRTLPPQSSRRASRSPSRPTACARTPHRA